MNTCSDATCEDMLNTQYYQQVQECDRRIHATCESKMKKKLHLESESGLNADFASRLNHQMAPCGDAFLAYNLKGCKLGLALGCLEKGLSRQSTGDGCVAERTALIVFIRVFFFSATHPKTRSWLRRVVVRSGMTRFFLTVCGLTQTFNTSRAVYRFFAQNSSNVFETRPSNGNNQRLNDGFGSSFASPSWMSVRDSVTLPFEQTVGPFR